MELRTMENSVANYYPVNNNYLVKTVKLLTILLTLIVTLLASNANLQQPNFDTNVYQREHSLVKPYQGAGMVSCNTIHPN